MTRALSYKALAWQVEAHQRAFMQTSAPHLAPDAANACHDRKAAVRPFEVMHARAALIVTRDPSDTRRFWLHAFREPRDHAAQKERQLVNDFKRRVRFRSEGDPDEAIVVSGEIVGKTGKLGNALACPDAVAREPQAKQTTPGSLGDNEAFAVAHPHETVGEAQTVHHLRQSYVRRAPVHTPRRQVLGEVLLPILKAGAPRRKGEEEIAIGRGVDVAAKDERLR